MGAIHRAPFIALWGEPIMPQGRYFDESADDESPDESSRPSRSLVSRPMPTVIDTAAMSAVRRSSRPQRDAADDEVDDEVDGDEAPEERFSRRALLRWGGAALAAAAGLSVLSQTPPVQRGISAIVHAAGGADPGQSTAPAATPRMLGGYFHACFEVNSPAEVDQAAALGINYTITYYEASWASADVNDPLGKALLRHGMKTFVNLEYPFLQCPDGYGHVSNLEEIRNLVARFKDSPLTAGYWIKDDDCTFTGDEQVALVGLYNLIRQIDDDPTHLITPGFGDAGSVARNYAHGCCDLMGFYPYPAYSRGPALEVPDMLKTVRERTPRGVQPPPFMGTYQAFATPPIRPVLPVANVIAQVQAYMENGAAAIAGFGWEAPNETHVISNDPTLRQAVGAVTQWLGQHGYGTPPPALAQG
jgi:hypothetical protein